MCVIDICRSFDRFSSWTSTPAARSWACIFLSCIESDEAFFGHEIAEVASGPANSTSDSRISVGEPVKVKFEYQQGSTGSKVVMQSQQFGASEC